MMAWSTQPASSRLTKSLVTLFGLCAGLILLLMVVQNVDFGYSTSTARGLPSDHKSTMKPHRPGINLTATDYKGAKDYLQKYQALFENRSLWGPLPDPSQPDTVTLWWQAAALIDWYTRSRPRYKCKKPKSFGNWAACMDPPYTPTPPCLVYSFGINYDFSFDDDMAKYGCEVHSFDPSMKMDDQKRGPRSWFYKLGLSSRSTDSFKPKKDSYVKDDKQVWKIRTLSAIKEQLGHTGRVIDVLKIDIETSEWEVLDNLMEAGLLSSVRQFSLEFHLFPGYPPFKDYVMLYKSYTKLREDNGFLEYSTNPHPSTYSKKRYNIQGDSQFVNSRFHYPDTKHRT